MPDHERLDEFPKSVKSFETYFSKDLKAYPTFQLSQRAPKVVDQ